MANTQAKRDDNFVPVLLGVNDSTGFTQPWKVDSNGRLLVSATFDTVTVAQGGTGKTSFTVYAVVCGGTTTTGALQSIASVGTAGQVLTSNGAGALPTFQAAAGGSGGYTLIHSGSGTDTSVGATNVDTASITGLTGNDTLIVFCTYQSVTQATASVLLYNSTDSVSFSDITNGSGVAAGTNGFADWNIRQLQSANTAIAAHLNSKDSTGSGLGNNYNGVTFTTAWTGSWTLALRHGGVTAGGTFRYAWSVFKATG